MKKVILYTLTASAAIAAYFALRNCACSTPDNDSLSSVKRQRHLTKAFSKAKQQFISEFE